MEKTLKVLASLFWIIGLILSIVGLNIQNETGQWMATVGNITFFIGLALQGVVWALMARNKKSPAEAGPENGEKNQP